MAWERLMRELFHGRHPGESFPSVAPAELAAGWATYDLIRLSQEQVTKGNLRRGVAPLNELCHRGLRFWAQDDSVVDEPFATKGVGLYKAHVAT